MKFRLINILTFLILYDFVITESAFTYQSDILVITDDLLTSSLQIVEDATAAGYNVTSVSPDTILPGHLESHRLIIVCTGNNTLPLLNRYLRKIIQNYAEDGGKLIIEGGQNAYVSIVEPRYAAFQNKVLKVINWTSHNGGNIKMSPEFSVSTLATVPNFLPLQINLNFLLNSDMDVCSNDPYSYSFYKSTTYPDKCGIVVYPDVNNPRIINYLFNYASIVSRSDAKNLLTNSIFNLIGNSVSVSSSNIALPSDYFLGQNYPNPFNPSTNLEFGLPEPGFVSLKVYDILGKEVSSLVNQTISAGVYKTGFDGRGFTSGMYFYRLVVSPENPGSAYEFTNTKSMMIVK